MARPLTLEEAVARSKLLKGEAKLRKIREQLPGLLGRFARIEQELSLGPEQAGRIATDEIRAMAKSLGIRLDEAAGCPTRSAE
jgi:hypothetical protein